MPQNIEALKEFIETLSSWDGKNVYSKALNKAFDYFNHSTREEGRSKYQFKFAFGVFDV